MEVRKKPRRSVGYLRIDKILEVTLALWAETERIHSIISVKPRRTKRKDHLMPNVTLDNAIAQLSQAVKDSIAAQEALLASHAAGTVTDADVQPILDQAKALAEETTKIVAATTPIP